MEFDRVFYAGRITKCTIEIHHASVTLHIASSALIIPDVKNDTCIVPLLLKNASLGCKSSRTTPQTANETVIPLSYDTSKTSLPTFLFVDHPECDVILSDICQPMKQSASCMILRCGLYEAYRAHRSHGEGSMVESHTAVHSAGFYFLQARKRAFAVVIMALTYRMSHPFHHFRQNMLFCFDTRRFPASPGN